MILLHFLILLFVFTYSVEAKENQNKVDDAKLHVIDGETFISSGERIYLWGIDAPKYDHPLYRVSRLYLETILSDGDTNCKIIEVDIHQRNLMFCSVNGLDIGSMMVRMGMARDFFQYSRGFYASEQREAQYYMRGVWAPSRPKNGQ